MLVRDKLMERIEVDFVIIGSGIAGLALCESLSRHFPSATIVLLERHSKWGQEISSHNSEVIHAGIYYEKFPVKAQHCIRGRSLLYQFCEDQGVPYRRCGKYIVATQKEQLPILEKLYNGAKAFNVELDTVDVKKVRQELRNPSLCAALWSPTTGIVDSHVLMERLLALSQERGVMSLFGCAFEKVENCEPGKISMVYREPSGDLQSLTAKAVFNCAGLAASKVFSEFKANSGFKIKPCRGRYFSLSSKFTHAYSSLVYPIPDPAGGLGVHITFDLSGKCRLGPDVDWSLQDAEADDAGLYRFSVADQDAIHKFYESGKRLIPSLEKEDLSPDYVGIRPKLFEQGQPYGDFLITQSIPSGTDWHLLGVESPGLTAALSLAEELSKRMSL